MAKPDTSAIKGFLDSSQKISIFLPAKPHFDAVAAALGLKLSLDLSGKTSRVICPDPMLVEFNRLVGVETISGSFGSRNLVISFPHQTEHVDNVTYNIESGILQLVITPKQEAPELDHRRLQFITSAGKQDLLITIGVTDLNQLGPVYKEAGELFHGETTATISISHLPHKTQFTLHQLHDYDSSGLSEITAHLIHDLGLNLDPDSASNLLAGLEKSTDSFRSPKVSVTTFEVAAKLMHRGARRSSDEISATDFPAGAIPGSAGTSQISVASESGSELIELAPDQIPVEQQMTDQSAPSAKTNGKKSAPPDWYEPKIYKGPMQP